MPIIKSAQKRAKTAKRNREQNLQYLAEVKNALSFFNKEKNAQKKEKLLSKTYSLIDKAAKKNILHKNKAARLKSRLQKNLDTRTKKK